MLNITRLLRYFSIKAYNVDKNYYKTLKISEQASPQDIKKAFRTLAKQYHPDSTNGHE